MKKIVTLLLLSLTMNSFAQIADAPENISPLLIGEKIPNIVLLDSDGVKVATNKIFNKKTVLVVYRGGWCPYCNSQLADMQEIENQIIELGYQVVAVSPDAPSFLKQTEDKKELKYQLYSDSEGKFAQALGIAFKREKGKNNLAFVDIWVGENEFIKLVVEMTENNWGFYGLEVDGVLGTTFVKENFKKFSKDEILKVVQNRK